MAVVIDASVAIAAVLPDEHSTYARSAIAIAVSEGLLVPAIWAYEVQNALLVAVRRDRIDEAIMREAVAALAAIRVDFHVPRRLGRDLDIAHTYGLTVYDAAYLSTALAAEAGTRLATFDKALRRAARAANVSVLTT